MRSIGLVLIAVGGFLLYLTATNKVTPAMSALFTGTLPTTAQEPTTKLPSIFDTPGQEATGGMRA